MTHLAEELRRDESAGRCRSIGARSTRDASDCSGPSRATSSPAPACRWWRPASPVLYAESATDASVATMPGPGILEAVAQEVSLTLANVRLHDMLLRHSVRDPLTGL